MKVQKTSAQVGKLRIEEKPRTLRELALERMRQAILEFHFKPGQRLVERDLCEQLGVSRSVVREVVRHLESEGLIQTKPHHGPIVAKLDVDTAKQIYELRAVLESAAAEAAAENASPSAIAEMSNALEKIEVAYVNEDYRKVLSATTMFYEAMFLSGGKSVAWEMVQRLNGRISWLRSMTVASPGRSMSGPTQMRQILEAVLNKDGSAASAACRMHLKVAGSIAQDLLEKISQNELEELSRE